jgi:hypothetical protein
VVSPLWAVIKRSFLNIFIASEEAIATKHQYSFKYEKKKEVVPSSETIAFNPRTDVQK